MFEALKACTGFIGALLIFYLLGAFCGWDANPGHWGGEGRTILAVIALTVAVMSAAAAALFERP